MKKKNNVIILSQYFPPDVSGGATRAFNYAKCLEQQNYNVTVITAHPHQHGPVPKNYSNKLTKKEKMGNLDLIRVWVPSLLHSSIKNSAILNFSFCFTSLFPLFSIKSKPDVILAFEPNLFSIIPAYFYSKLRGGIVLRIVDDMWPELLYEQKILKSNFLRKLLTRLAKFSYNYSKHIIPLNNEIKEIIHKSYGIDNDKIDASLNTMDWPLPLVFRAGVSKDIIQSDKIKLTVAADAIHPNNNVEYLNLGFEYVFQNMISIRGGQSFYGMDQSKEGLTFGIGLNYQTPRGPKVSFDYVYRDIGVFDNIPGYSLNIIF